MNRLACVALIGCFCLGLASAAEESTHRQQKPSLQPIPHPYPFQAKFNNLQQNANGAVASGTALGSMVMLALGFLFVIVFIFPLLQAFSQPMATGKRSVEDFDVKPRPEELSKHPALAILDNMKHLGIEGECRQKIMCELNGDRDGSKGNMGELVFSIFGVESPNEDPQVKEYLKEEYESFKDASKKGRENADCSKEYNCSKSYKDYLDAKGE